MDPASLREKYGLARMYPIPLARYRRRCAMRSPSSVVVFSDVDGILFDRRTRSFRDAAAASDLLNRCQIPLILCSGRTRAELERVQQQLGIRHPFICEHGAAVFIPRGYFAYDVKSARNVAGYQAVEFGSPYSQVVDTLHRVARWLRIDVIGFSDMSIGDVATARGLPLIEARLAKLREYGEPFHVLGSDGRARQRLFKALRAESFGCASYEQYDHVGARVDIDVGARFLCALYRGMLGHMTSVAFGVTSGDAPLLRSVDVPFVVRNDEDPVSVLWTQVSNARVTTRSGLAGFSEAIAEVVEGAFRRSEAYH
jgi:mannosyl-3-phosphoglycerate phosphatase